LKVALYDKNLFKEKTGNNKMNKWIEILLGLIFLNGAIFTWWVNFWNFGEAALNFFKGGLVWLVILVGFIFIILGISDLKD
jgi:hypothetical protein